MLTWMKELPLWIPIGLAVIGMILVWTGLTHQEKWLKMGGAVVAGVAIVLGLVSYFLESGREICLRQTRELVSAVEMRDWAAMGKLLDEDFSVLDWQGRDEIVATARKYTEQYDINGLRTTGLTASKPAPTVIVHVRIWANVGKQPVGFTDWRLDWGQNGERWLLESATPLSEIPGITSMFRRQLSPL